MPLKRKFEQKVKNFLDIEIEIRHKYPTRKFIIATKVRSFANKWTNKHRCPKCRKLRTFSKVGIKKWAQADNKWFCGFCYAKEQGILEDFQKKLSKLR